jgi:hypothetical protein
MTAILEGLLEVGDARPLEDIGSLVTFFDSGTLLRAGYAGTSAMIVCSDFCSKHI